MEGGRSPFNGMGWMQASVKSLRVHKMRGACGAGPEQAGRHAGSLMAPSECNRAAVRALPHNTLPGPWDPRTSFFYR
jgi:hypothetical protein